MAINYLAGNAVAQQRPFAQNERIDQVAQPGAGEAAQSGRIFIDEERYEREFFPFKQAEKAPWVSLFLNQLRIFF